jgi:serine/threonine protein kinase
VGNPETATASSRAGDTSGQTGASAFAERAAAALRREAELMAPLDHPHVVKVLDSGIRAGRPYLVMEYVEGVSLRAKMTSGRAWRAAQAIPALTAITDALTYIHQRGILHLDLKPENVLCGIDGSIKITDFGLATVNPHPAVPLNPPPLPDSADGPAVKDNLQVVQGTIDYCPPEQRHGLPVDQRTDLFALAVLSYELLTGRLPGRVYVPASSYCPRLHPDVDVEFARGLARAPEDRPPSVEAWWQPLLAALHRPSWRWWRWLMPARR